MKTSSKLLRFLAVGAVACMLLPITLPAARDGDAQLVVKRAANFGSNLDLTVIVDGQKVGRVIFGHEYTGTLSPGRHTVTVKVSSKLHRSVPASRRIDAAPGQSYRLTAGFAGEDLALQ